MSSMSCRSSFFESYVYELNKSHFGIFVLGVSVFTSGDSVGCNMYKEIV